jgi:hypothetical protein
MAIADKTPFTSYSGLYPCCHQVKVEMDSECAKVLRTYPCNLQSQIPSTHIDVSNASLYMQHIRLLLDREGSVKISCAHARDLSHFCCLQSASTTFVLENTNHSSIQAFPALGAMCCHFIFRQGAHSEGSLPGRIQLEILSLNQQVAHQVGDLAGEFEVMSPKNLKDWK